MQNFHANPRIMLPLRGVALLFTLIELGLTAYGVSVFNGTAYGGFGYYYTVHFGAINFLLFASLWTLLVLIYFFVSMRMTHLTHPFATLALCAVTMIFWFAGFIAVAVGISGAIDCVGPCGVLAAAAAFGAFLWLIFLADTIFAALAAFGGHSTLHDHGSTQMAAA